MQTIKVSIIMGIFKPNNEEQIFQSIQSIIEQDFKDWEFIICNDGSDEKYEPVFTKISSLDERIVYLKAERNQGLASALNQCLAVSKGKYIARMDDDDISLPQRLSTLYNFLEEHLEYGWVGSNAELLGEQGIWGTRKVKEKPAKTDFLPHSPYIHPSVMFRREVLEKMGGYNTSKLTQRCEDYELFMRLHQEGYKGYNIQESLLLYREDANSYQRRKYKFRVREMRVRYAEFKKLGILRISTLPYVMKPVLVGLVPFAVYKHLKNKRINHS